MLWDTPKLPLTLEALKGVLNDAAVYVLWMGDVPIHAGFATRLSMELRQRLLQDISLPRGAPTHFSYFRTDDPLPLLNEALARMAAALKDFDRISGRGRTD